MPANPPGEFPEHNYIRRRGRFTSGQARAMSELVEGYRAATIQPARGDTKVGVEIGFGMGDALLQWATSCPQWTLYGVELYQPGIGSMVLGMERAQINNVHVVERPAQLVLGEVADGSIDEIRIFFPDPWPKKRHAKRRIIQPDFVTTLARVIRAPQNAQLSGGIVRVATDWQPYADWMQACFTHCDEFAMTQQRRQHRTDQTDHQPGLDARTPTKFETRGQRLGHDIYDFELRRI